MPKAEALIYSVEHIVKTLNEAPDEPRGFVGRAEGAVAQ